MTIARNDDDDLVTRLVALFAREGLALTADGRRDLAEKVLAEVRKALGEKISEKLGEGIPPKPRKK
jgi:hypothetical protein